MSLSKIDFDAKDFLSNIDIAMMDNKEIGKLITKICLACEKEDVDYLSQFNFIGKLYKESGKRKHIPQRIRKKILSIGYCLFCGSKERLTIDHIIPVSKNGGNNEENLQCLCSKCNSKKGVN